LISFGYKSIVFPVKAPCAAPLIAPLPLSLATVFADLVSPFFSTLSFVAFASSAVFMPLSTL
jgi:hypothetical protein